MAFLPPRAMAPHAASVARLPGPVCCWLTNNVDDPCALAGGAPSHQGVEATLMRPRLAWLAADHGPRRPLRSALWGRARNAGVGHLIRCFWRPCPGKCEVRHAIPRGGLSRDDRGGRRGWWQPDRAARPARRERARAAASWRPTRASSTPRCAPLA